MAGLLVTANAVGQFSAHRQLLVFGNKTNELRIKEQLQILEKASDGIKERDIEISVVAESSSLYKKYGIKAGQFTVVLVGKDGGEKYRTEKLLQTPELFAIIDAMPMRRKEMKAGR
jgi:hypothetical protein